MDLENPVIKLCAAGSRAEFDGRADAARALYQQAWAQASDDFEACVAAHYMARRHEDPAVALAWNLTALAHADAAKAAGDTRSADFYGSLYVNVGHAYALTGEDAVARRYYALAAAHGVVHQPD